MHTSRLPGDFREFLELLNQHEVAYLLVGGYAVVVHGYPRATADLNVWVEAAPANAARLVAALDAFGFGPPEVREELFLAAGAAVRIGMPPLRIEIITDLPRESFADCQARRVTALLDGVPVAAISLEDLERTKRTAGRPRDLEDLRELERLRRMAGREARVTEPAPRAFPDSRPQFS